VKRLTVWYNTKCPVCDAGINWQKNRLLQAVKGGEIEFRDINLEPQALASFGANIEDIRRRLYGLDADGRLFIGADCAIEIWRRTPGDRWLATVLGLPILRQLTRFSYDGFASLLYAWNRRKGHW
jgi:predicted DCC family thiol-disulfide oxidoreductase YuxK